MALTGLAPGILEVCEGGQIWLYLVWHRGSLKSARVPKTVADRCNELGRLPSGRLEPGILEVCDGAKDSRRPVQCTREGP